MCDKNRAMQSDILIINKAWKTFYTEYDNLKDHVSIPNEYWCPFSKINVNV